MPYSNEPNSNPIIIAPQIAPNLEPIFHSTQIEPKTKITSTMIKKTSTTYDIDPCVSQISSDFSSSYNSSSTSEYSSDYSSSSTSSTTVHHDQDTLYVCCIAYKPKIQGDLNLAFADRVKLIHMNDDYALVENILTKQCGYVPRFCISTMSQFLTELKYLNKQK